MTPESSPSASSSTSPVSSPVTSAQATPQSMPPSVPDGPPDGTGLLWVDVVGIVLLSVLLWTGIRKIEISGYWKALLALLDLGLLAYAVFDLGWNRALGIVVGVNAILFFGRWLRFVAGHDDVLAHAASVSGSIKSELKALAGRLPQNYKVFRYLGPMRTARLIDHLSDRARTIPEIEDMAPPIAMLWVIDRPDLGKFVDDFDRLLRLWNKAASEAMAVADTMSAASRRSRMTIQEAIDSLIGFTEASPGMAGDRGADPSAGNETR